ncbi:MAG: DinB family protein [Actinomycetota bacterium]|nr:DinB family protein [Actinomycetota bacterium]
MRCDECGFDDSELSSDDAIAALRRFAKRYRAPLTRLLPNEDGSVLRRRPEPTTWSALEYAAHVRDVFGEDASRVRRTLDEDRPEFTDPGPDELAASRRYNDQDPVTVADELGANAELLASTLEAVPPDGWDRVGLRHGEERSVLFTARVAVHEGNHHLLDVGRSLRAARDAARR